MVAVVLSLLLAIPSSTDNRDVGESHICQCAGEESSEDHYSWWFPIVSLPSPKASAMVNAAIRRDVARALGLRTLKRRARCSCKNTDPLLFLTHADYCELTYQSVAFISFRCSTEQTFAMRTGTRYRSLILQVSGESVRQISSGDIFPGQEATQAVKGILMTKIIEICRNPENERENMVDEDEFPRLVDAMLSTAVLTREGVAFLALGSHHSAFEATIPFERLKKWLNPKILSDVSRR